jgi:hypothetical protein
MLLDGITQTGGKFYGFFARASGRDASACRRWLRLVRQTEIAMQANREEPPPTTVTGTVMRLGEQHHVAIYTRNGTCWIAEFRGGRAELSDAATWMRMVPAALNSHRGRKVALDSMTDLTADVRARIEALHRRASDQEPAGATGGAWAVACRRCAQFAASLRRAMAPRFHRP